MKLIFLDIDGVLNSILHTMIRSMKKINSIDCITKPLLNLNAYNIDLLRLVVEKTQAKIVISSTWRKDPILFNPETSENEKIQTFKDFFAHFGWEDAPIIGITPSLYTIRGHEVATYLEELSKTEKIEDYIILDDDSDFILETLEQLKDYQLDKMGLLEKEKQLKQSKYWFYQKLLVTNKLTGLSYNDVISILKLWCPQDELVVLHKKYEPYLDGYGPINFDKN